ncbi:MAG: HlyD family efflux transporter periplasmic adaptor subunit [Tannerellaceae bacterium]|jgi:HlyD family secretion protein|nr:HlyD family efflux transporter periplasmic adaptor subunit [Tannerellaceae bacterium]
MTQSNLPLCIVLTIIATLTGACHADEHRADATGVFEAAEIVVSSEVSGKIMELGIREGDRINAGHYAGYIDSAQLYLKKRQLAAGLKAIDIRRPDIRRQIAVLEQQIAAARTEQLRMENLVKANAGNQKQADDIANSIRLLQKQADAQYSTLRKTSGSAGAEAEALQYQIMQLDDQLQKCRIINPQTGTVLVKYAEPGEVTIAGKPLYKIADTGLLYLRAYITADQLNGLKQGQTVRVFACFGKAGHREYSGVISWISGKAEFTPKGIQTKDERANLVYAIRIAVKNDGYLKIGQYGEVLFAQAAALSHHPGADNE